MNIVSDVKEWQALYKNNKNKTLGFIPTMGNLHAGHLSLCQRSQAENEVTAVSIFVNPTQFDRDDDFKQYPRTLEKDKMVLATQGVDYLFLPDANTLYPDQYQIQVTETEISQTLEGAFRPGHFNGMLTVVLKLLNIIRPSRMYMGEKDYQQFLLLQKMVKALFIETEVIPCKTVRDEDGLALSSRNSRLSATQRQKAGYFPRLLQSSTTPEKMAENLLELGFKVDYIAEKWKRRLGAVWLDEVRLIDNISLEQIE